MGKELYPIFILDQVRVKTVPGDPSGHDLFIRCTIRAILNYLRIWESILKKLKKMEDARSGFGVGTKSSRSDCVILRTCSLAHRT